MPRLKGMDTWMWLIGGIIITLLCFVIFMEIFSSITAQNHTQVSFETQANLASDVNRLCSMLEGQSQKQTLKFSTIATDFFASDNTTLIGKDVRTYGKRLCLNVSGKVSCEDLDCPIELDPIIKEKKILNLLDKLKGELNYREYEVELVRTKCGVSVLKNKDDVSCACGFGDEYPYLYYEYNGVQPLLFSNEGSAVLADTFTLEYPDENTSVLLGNIVRYLGGTKILVVYEKDSLTPETAPLKPIFDYLKGTGYDIQSLKHNQAVNFSGYDQIWLITPGFCESGGKGCEGISKWRESEIQELIKTAKEGKGVFLITDSGVSNSSKSNVYQELNLRVVNDLLYGLGYPYQQVPSCVGACGEDGVLEAKVGMIGPLVSGIDFYRINSMAVFDESCRYQEKYIPGEGLGYLIYYKDSPVVLLGKNVLIILDTTPYINSAVFDGNALRLVGNAAGYFGEKLLIVWEDSCIWNSTYVNGEVSCVGTRDAFPENSKLMTGVSRKSSYIDFFFHERPLTLDDMKKYNQVWFLRPGWCEYTSGSFSRLAQNYCSGAVSWKNEEISAIENYVASGGNITVFVDYNPYLPERTVNGIFQALNLGLDVKKGFIGAGFTTDVKSHPLTNGISRYPVRAVSIVEIK